MAIVPAKQIAPFTMKTASFTTNLLDLNNYSQRSHTQVLTLTNVPRAFIRTIRLSRTPASFNTGTYGDYTGQSGYNIAVKLYDFVTIATNYSDIYYTKDSSTLSSNTVYDASTSGIVLDFNMDTWYSNQAIGTNNIYLPIVIQDNTAISSGHGTSVKYDVVVYYDSVNAV